MKTQLLSLLCIAVLAGGARADWQQELSPPAPGNFAPLRPMHAHFKFGWTALTAAEATFDYSKAKAGLMKMDVNAKSTGAVRSLWRMDTQHTALMRSVTLRPVSLRQTEIYKDETIKTKLDFDASGVTHLRETIPNTGKPPKPKRYDYPNLLDLNSTLQWIRSQRLANGDSYKMVVYPSSAPYLAEIDVAGRQKLSVAGHSWDAIKVSLRLWRIDDQFQLQPHRKFKNATIWVSDDADRLPIKIEAEIFVGSVWAEMDSVQFK